VTLKLSTKIIDEALVGGTVHEFRIFTHIMSVAFDTKYDGIGAKSVISFFTVQIVSFLVDPCVVFTFCFFSFFFFFVYSVIENHL